MGENPGKNQIIRIQFIIFQKKLHDRHLNCNFSKKTANLHHKLQFSNKNSKFAPKTADLQLRLQFSKKNSEILQI